MNRTIEMDLNLCYLCIEHSSSIIDVVENLEWIKHTE